jgi:glycosyltransferase involved in cell wall biosynthesis
MSDRSDKLDKLDKLDKITFIIPTIGRDTLLNSINSLFNQTIKDWKAIIIFDGIKSNIMMNDKRIKIIEIEKKGKDVNSAGEVRNYGMSFVNTEWIAFLDDDDIIADDYIETFYKENDLYEYEKEEELDVLIYRMKMGERIVPKLKTDDIHLCDIGISFIMRKEIYDNGLKFIADGAEDYLYLDLIKKNNYNMMISPHIKYFVKEIDYNENDISKQTLGNRVYINNNIINNKIILLGYLSYLINNNVAKTS